MSLQQSLDFQLNSHAICDNQQTKRHDFLLLNILSQFHFLDPVILLCLRAVFILSYSLLWLNLSALWLLWPTSASLPSALAHASRILRLITVRQLLLSPTIQLYQDLLPYYHLLLRLVP